MIFEETLTRIIYEPDGFGGKCKAYQLFPRIKVFEGGWYKGRSWMTAKFFTAALARWVRNSYETGQAQPPVAGWGPGEVPHQCGGCRWHAAFDSDYGFCCNEASPNDGRVVFEHGGCAEHSYYDD